MPRQPTLKQLQYLCAIADHLHFGRAANACNVSQSTLSGAMLELEQTLGVTLVERGSRRVLLTSAGDNLVRRARLILCEVKDLMAAAEAARHPCNNELRLGMIPTIAPFLLPDALTALRQSQPGTRLYVSEAVSARLVEGLASGELDLLLMALPCPTERTESLPLFNDELLLACPPDHPLVDTPELHIGDLKGQDLLLLEDGHCLRDHALEACRLTLDEVSVPGRASSLDTLIRMTASRIGLTLIPRIALNAGVTTQAGIVTRSFSDPEVHRTIGIMWRARSPRREEFLRFGERLRALQSRSVDSPVKLAV
ncbi:MAG: LysR substrate-binding domain-containing protein [Pseudomonadota bacterium]